MAESSEQGATVPDWILAGVSEDSNRPAIMLPWEIDWQGERWTIATNGHFAILARGCFGAPDANGPDSIAPTFTNILIPPTDPERHDLNIAALRAWIGLDRVVPTCEVCNGVSEWKCPDCDGEGETECECICGHEHQIECKTCRGSGTAKCPSCLPSSREIERGMVFGQAFDLKLLRRAVAKLPFERATWVRARRGQDEKCAWIEGDDWRILIMPIRIEGPRAELPSFPSSAVTA